MTSFSEAIRTGRWLTPARLRTYCLILAGLDSSQQQVIRGVIIILAVALARNK